MLMKSTCIAALAAFVVGSAYADDGDAFRGKAFAQQLCAGCHSIEKDRASSPLGPAPAFIDVAARSDSWTAESFANWLGTRHPVINGMAVKPVVATDILVYIRSLGPSKQQAALDR